VDEDLTVTSVGAIAGFWLVSLSSLPQQLRMIAKRLTSNTSTLTPDPEPDDAPPVPAEAADDLLCAPANPLLGPMPIFPRKTILILVHSRSDAVELEVLFPDAAGKVDLEDLDFDLVLCSCLPVFDCICADGRPCPEPEPLPG
jgi:hypothetical protein